MVDPGDKNLGSGRQASPNPAETPGAENIDALLDAVASEPFGEDQVHRLMQKVRLRLIVERIKDRDDAAAQLIALLREAGSVAGKAHNAPMATPPELRAERASFQMEASPNPVCSRLPRRLRPVAHSARSKSSPVPARTLPRFYPPAIAMPLSKRARGARLAMRAAVLLLVAAGVVGSISLFRENRHQTLLAERRADDNLQFVEDVVREWCVPAPNSCIPVPKTVPDLEDRAPTRKALAICRRFIQRNAGDPQRRRELGKAHYWAGSILMLLGYSDEARVSYEQALPLLTAGIEENGADPPLQIALAEIKLNTARLLVESGHPSQQIEGAFKEALSAYGALGQRPDTQLGLAVTRLHQGAFFQRTGRGDQAETDYRQALRILSSFKDQETPSLGKYGLATVQAHVALGQLYLQGARLNGAQDAFLKATSLLAKMPAKGPGIAEHRTALAWQWYNLSRELRDARRAVDSASACTQATDLWADLIKTSEHESAYRHFLGLAFTQQGLLLRDAGDLAQACVYFQKAASQIEKALTIRRDDEYKLSLRDAYLALAATSLRRSDHRTGAVAADMLPAIFPGDWQEHYRSVYFLAWCMNLADRDRTQTVSRRRDIITDYRQRLNRQLDAVAQRSSKEAGAANALAWFLATSARPDLRNASRALELARVAVRMKPENKAYWNTLGVSQYRSGNWNDAVTALEKSKSLGEEGADWFFLAMAHWKLGHKAQARDCYLRAVRWREQHPRDEELSRFLAETMELIGPWDALVAADGGHATLAER